MGLEDVIKQSDYTQTFQTSNGIFHLCNSVPRIAIKLNNLAVLPCFPLELHVINQYDIFHGTSKTYQTYKT